MNKKMQYKYLRQSAAQTIDFKCSRGAFGGVVVFIYFFFCKAFNELFHLLIDAQLLLVFVGQAKEREGKYHHI